MTDPESSPQPVSTTASKSDESEEVASTRESSGLPMSRDQADQILTELKGIQQKLVWFLVVAGFFAARSFFFHY